MKLQIGMRVRIRDDKANFAGHAGTVKTITKELGEEIKVCFDGERCFELDDSSSGIWLIEDFSECVDYPELPME